MEPLGLKRLRPEGGFAHHDALGTSYSSHGGAGGAAGAGDLNNNSALLFHNSSYSSSALSASFDASGTAGSLGSVGTAGATGGKCKLCKVFETQLKQTELLRQLDKDAAAVVQSEMESSISKLQGQVRQLAATIEGSKSGSGAAGGPGTGSSDAAAVAAAGRSSHELHSLRASLERVQLERDEKDAELERLQAYLQELVGGTGEEAAVGEHCGQQGGRGGGRMRRGRRRGSRQGLCRVHIHFLIYLVMRPHIFSPHHFLSSCAASATVQQQQALRGSH